MARNERSAARSSGGIGGDENRRESFEREALPHLRAVYNLSLRLCHNEKDAEDLAQDTFLRAYRFFHRFESGTNIRAWLFRILKNLFLNRIQPKKPVQDPEGMERLEDLPAPPGGGWLAAPSPTPEEEALSSVTASQVERAIDALQPDYKIVVTLALVEEMSYKEIAGILELPLGTVMSRLHRGRKILQRNLGSLREISHPRTASA